MPSRLLPGARAYSVLLWRPPRPIGHSSEGNNSPPLEGQGVVKFPILIPQQFLTRSRMKA